MHVRLGDVFDNDWDIIIPSTNGLIVRRGDKSPILIYKGDGIHRP